MAGIKGAKQNKALSAEQIEELFGMLIFTEDALDFFLKKHSLTFTAFKRKATVSGLKIPFGYSYFEYRDRPKLQSPFNKSKLRIDCSCGKVYITVLFGFHKRKYKTPVCDDCYRKNYAYDIEWRTNNSKAQKVAQNRPETIRKQIKSQNKRYAQPEVIEHYRRIGKKLWEDPIYRKKVIKNSSIAKAGIYHGLTYQSSIELAYILWCEENNKQIQNYTGSGIPYIWNGKEHRYYPDFLVDNDLIVEIKGSGGFYKRFASQNQAKFAALQEWCKSNNFTNQLIFDTDLGNKAIKEAKILHGTLSEKNNDSI